MTELPILLMAEDLLTTEGLSFLKWGRVLIR